MSTQRKELVATADAVISMNETSLKWLTIMFSRIAIPALNVDFSRTSLFSPEFLKVRAWLAELGVFFDLDMQKLKSSTVQDYAKVRDLILEDSDLFTKPTYGMSTQEMIASRGDEEKVAEIRRRGAEAGKKLQDGSLDPVKMMEISLRMSTNMSRMAVSQLREVENLDAYLVMHPQLSSFEQDDPRLTKYDVVRIGIGALPVPVDHVPWEQLLEYRNDPVTKGSFMLIKDWMSEAARGVLTPAQIEESLDYLIDRFRRNQETHGINTTTTGLFAYVVTTPEFLENLAGVGPDWGTRALFEMDHCNIGLLDCESTTPGNIVGFLLQTDPGFSLGN